MNCFELFAGCGGSLWIHQNNFKIVVANELDEDSKNL